MPFWAEQPVPTTVWTSLAEAAGEPRYAFPIIAVGVVLVVMGLFWPTKRLDVEGKHCIVTGASQGLGLAVAQQLAARGAHVTIMARTEAKLKAGVELIKAGRRSPDQHIAYVSVDLRDAADTARGFDAACAHFDGRAPDVVIASAGGAGGYLGFFAEMAPEQFLDAWQTNYLTTLWTAREGVRRMARQGVRGHVVLVSSVAGYLGFTGYSAYAPAKAALRSLTDVLHMECLPYGIKVHCQFPGGIDSPGYLEEEKGKPAITKVIEGGDTVLSPEACAQGLLRGLDRGEVFIANDINGHFGRTGMKGQGPRSSWLPDFFYGVIASIGLPIWRMISERQTMQHTKDHVAALRATKQP